MQLTVNFIDAFTDTPFSGNPAAVIELDGWLDDELMQQIATENNLSETAFLVSCGVNAYKIRWFSPIMEIDFCGHATLASAFVLFKRDESVQTLTFSAAAVGELVVEKGQQGFMQMSFPNRKPQRISDIPDELLAGLSIAPVEVYLSQQAYFAVYRNEDDVHAVTPALDRLKALAPYDVVVTAPATNYDFISRYFWPASGGEEDPVTGSIHAGLAPLWADKLGRNQLRAFQASRRGGELNCTIEGDRVLVSGQAVQYLQGTITV